LTAIELFFIFPTNVDGLLQHYNYQLECKPPRMRRKNMAEATCGANADGSGGDGVDINRNYPTW
jgi:hypothetical protein